MKTLSAIFTEAKSGNTSWPESQAWVSADTNKKYLEVATRLLSKEAKLVISFLVDNQDVSDEDLKKLVASGGTSEKEKDVVAALKHLKKHRRLAEIPMFQKPEQTAQVLSKEATVDELILDFDTEKGRADIVERYQALVMKIAQGYKGKTNIPFEDILASGNVGLVKAINMYAKSGEKGDGVIKQEMDKMTAELGDEGKKVDSTWVSFGVFASQRILFEIREDIKKYAHTVKVPASVQSKERKTNGVNAKSRSISGDAEIGGDKSGKSTVFDKIMGDKTDSIGGSEANDLLQELYGAIKKKFSERDVNIFMDTFGLVSDEKKKAKDIAKEYGVAPSNITAIKLKIINFIRKDKNLMNICQEVMQYFNESVQVAQYIDNTSNRIVECQETGKKFRIICN